MIRTTARTARKPHHCSRCERPIPTGERHLEHVAAPGNNDLGNDGWWRLRECAGCAELYGRAIPAEPKTSDQSAAKGIL